ncbi:hypothetical protein COLO4_11197 [Corchorus olitorius]|uniref:Transcription repressor n=1 Tax=Corchorus olitorius TaxID=93759 RepID=A0A1R3K5J1_9ROSI|nr:hypothetical protein COLO4_11197 [Corchorus olitorius]
MGNYRFRLSDMIPNAWFYKLKDMSKTRKHYTSRPLKKKPPSSSYSSPSQKSHINSKTSRYSYYFTTEPIKPAARFYNPSVHLEALGTPRKSLKRRDRRRTIYKPSPRVVSTLTESPDYSLSPFESSPEADDQSLVSESDDDEFFAPAAKAYDLPLPGSYSNSFKCKLSSSTTDIIIDMNNESHTRKFDMVDGFDEISELELPPILTKPGAKSNQKADHHEGEVTKFKRSSSRSFSVKIVKEESIRSQKEITRSTSPHGRKSISNSPGIKLRANSPRIASKKIQAYARKSTVSSSRNRSISESLAVVKSSFDPQRDFRDSMVEMIVENNIRASKDLEDLLACYLSLNSKQYHDLIIKAFEQIWLDLTNLHL